MPPLNGAAGKPAKTVPRRAASKPVVPALPLNYPQRPAVTRPISNTSTSSPSTPPLTNGQGTQEKTGEHNTTAHHEPATEQRREGGPSSAGNHPDAVAPMQAASASAPAAPPVASSEKVTATPTAPAAVPDQLFASPTPTRPPAPPVTTFNNMRVFDRTTHDPAAPAFQPPMVSHPPFHQAHPSNGSLIFGQLHDSNASSPAPHSGGSFPPPPPGIMPYPPVSRPVATVDGYGRPLMVSPTLDGYSLAVANHHGPPTPHSFQGSQSSVPAEETNFSPYPSVNGHNSFLPDRSHHGPVHAQGINHHINDALHLSAPPGYQNHCDQDDALAFLRHGASDNSFTDCTVEVRFPATSQHWDHPDFRQLQPLFRAPAHRFVLSRSPMLNALMKSLGTPAGGIIYLEPHDEFMRPDVFGFTFRWLYGWSLGDGILPTDLRPRDVRDDMKTTLSYIATARYVQLGWVFSTAVQRATRLLCWETVELAITFVMPSVIISRRGEDFSLSGLLSQILDFIVSEFPRDFVFDPNAGDNGFTRLPPIGPSPPNPNAPPIAHSNSATSHSRQSSAGQANVSRNQRLSSNFRFAQIKQIKFGDISPADQNGHDVANPSEAGEVRRVPTPQETMLSRILLNLPFELLKRVLEDPHLAKHSGDVAHAARHKMISDIVAQREARRLASLEQMSPQVERYKQALANAVSPLTVEELVDFYVNSLGFREEVFLGDGPYLARTWTRGAAGATST